MGRAVLITFPPPQGTSSMHACMHTRFVFHLSISSNGAVRGSVAKSTACMQDFMNGVCTNILHMQHKKMVTYAGNYDTFVTARAQLEEQQMKKYNWEQEQVRPVAVVGGSCFRQNRSYLSGLFLGTT